MEAVSIKTSSQYLWNFLLSCVLSHVQLFVTPWTVACQAPLSMGFSKQDYWSGLPFPLLSHKEDEGGFQKFPSGVSYLILGSRDKI